MQPLVLVFLEYFSAALSSNPTVQRSLILCKATHEINIGLSPKSAAVLSGEASTGTVIVAGPNGVRKTKTGVTKPASPSDLSGCEMLV